MCRTNSANSNASRTVALSVSLSMYENILIMRSFCGGINDSDIAVGLQLLEQCLHVCLYLAIVQNTIKNENNMNTSPLSVKVIAPLILPPCTYTIRQPPIPHSHSHKRPCCYDLRHTFERSRLRSAPGTCGRNNPSPPSFSHTTYNPCNPYSP